jgi:predicted Zn finger-like uncharacterized protein
MLLSCSSCGTRFLLDAAALGPHGRTVRCGRCSHDWFQAPPDDPAPAVEPAQPPPSAEYKPVPNLPAIRAPDRVSRAPTIWLLLVILVAATIGAGYYGRDHVMRLWPPSAQIYERIAVAIGVSFRTADHPLKIAAVRARRTTLGDRPVLVVEGDLANPTDRAVDVPRLRVVLRDAARRKISEAVFRAVKQRMVPGEELPFRTYIANPPTDAADVSVHFVAE